MFPHQMFIQVLVIICHCVLELKNTNDSILYTSNQYDSFDLFYMDSLDLNSVLNEGFSQLVSGDSASFYISLETFYNDYLKVRLAKILYK